MEPITTMDRKPDPLFWDQLLGSIEEGKVIPVVGQDLLTLEVGGEKTRVYRLLAQRLAEYLQVPTTNLPAGGELDEVARRYLFPQQPGAREPDPGYVYSGLKRVSDDLEIPKPLLQLAEIEPLKLFVSTVFVPSLEAALNARRYDGQPRAASLKYSPSGPEDLPAPVRDLDRATVFHLFGQLSNVPSSFAVTEADILEFVYSLLADTRRPSRLFQELKEHQLLILGCSFPDWLTRFFVRVARGAPFSEGHNKSFLADRRVRNNAHLTEFLESFSRQGIYVFEAGGAVEFVDQLHACWRERHPEPLAEGDGDDSGGGGKIRVPKMDAGSVFLSYAREDQAAARKIRDALSTKVDVWFDETRLEGGDEFRTKIEQNIRRCSLFVPVISRSVLDEAPNRFFRREWRYALDVEKDRPFGKTFILPTAIDDTPPEATQLPPRFSKLNWQRLPAGEVSNRYAALVADRYREHQIR